MPCKRPAAKVLKRPSAPPLRKQPRGETSQIESRAAQQRDKFLNCIVSVYECAACLAAREVPTSMAQALPLRCLMRKYGCNAQTTVSAWRAHRCLLDEEADQALVKQIVQERNRIVADAFGEARGLDVLQLQRVATSLSTSGASSGNFMAYVRHLAWANLVQKDPTLTAAGPARAEPLEKNYSAIRARAVASKLDTTSEPGRYYECRMCAAPRFIPSATAGTKYMKCVNYKTACSQGRGIACPTHSMVWKWRECPRLPSKIVVERLAAVREAMVREGRQLDEGSTDAAAYFERVRSSACTAVASEQIRLCAVAVFTDGERLLAGYSDHIARVWRMSPLAELQQLRGHTGAVIAVSTIGQHARVATYSAEQIIVWSLESCEQLVTICARSPQVLALGPRLLNSNVHMEAAADGQKIFLCVATESLQTFSTENAGRLI